MRKIDQAERLIQVAMEDGHIPGLSVAILSRGLPLLLRGYGLANVELRVSATPDTVFQIASLTKQFTATAIMLLREDGQLSLDDSLTAYVPELPPSHQKVSIRHLLTHTSGLKSYTEQPEMGKRLAGQPLSSEEFLSLTTKLVPDALPGEVFAYNNSGYFLLGLIIEKISELTYGEFLQGRIFGPLQMTRTHLNDSNALIPDRASGYLWNGHTLSNAPSVHPTQPFAAGALVSCVADLVKWENALAAATLLAPPIWQEMWTAAELLNGTATGYGYGWRLDGANPHQRVHHGGGIPGFRAYILRYPDNGLSVSLLSNRGNADIDPLVANLASLFLS